MKNLLSGILLEIAMTLACWIIIICGLWKIGELGWMLIQFLCRTSSKSDPWA